MQVLFFTCLVLPGMFVVATATSAAAAAAASSNGGRFHEKLFHAPANATALLGKYIVAFTADTSEADMETTFQSWFNEVSGVTRRHTFKNAAFKAISISVDDDDENNTQDLFTAASSENARNIFRLRRQAKLAKMLDNPRVWMIEEQQRYQKSATRTQYSPPSYGLDRIDQEFGLDYSYTYRQTGRGVRVYILDTGIRSTHVDFGGRVSCGFDWFGDDCDDEDGHGTHVAGTVGGATYGVAKEVSLVAVKVLNSDGAGDTEGVISGINYVAEQGANSDGPIVVNMSLGGFRSFFINVATASAAESQVVFVTAAGNEDINACILSPASSSAAITVAATDRDDRRLSFSNHGGCVDIFAPGEEITSAWSNRDNGEETISGTSMASPHVAGVAALYIEQYPTATVTEIRERLMNDALAGVVSDPNGSTNLMVNTGKLLEAAPPTISPTQPTTAAPTISPTTRHSVLPSSRPSETSLPGSGQSSAKGWSLEAFILVVCGLALFW